LSAADGSQLWAFETNGSIFSSPAVGSDGTVYVGSNDNHLYALDPDDGSLKWFFETDGSLLSSPALAADGTVYVSSYGGYVYAIR
jgi:outer membrane protein assembly factor BamB